METGTDLKHLVLFDKGQPTSDVTYELSDQSGNPITSGVATITPGQMSLLIEIDGSFNSMTLPLFEQMKLTWSYTTATAAISDSYQYRLHAAINFPVSISSVRNLLGVDPEELPDREVDLFAGYLSFLDRLSDTADLTPYENAGTLDSYRITTAIEAAAALEIFPTIQIRLPKKYNSGTSEYERWTTIDWKMLEAQLNTKLATGLTVVEADVELFPASDIFGISDADTDAITGA